jgi:hypothetical protein
MSTALEISPKFDNKVGKTVVGTDWDESEVYRLVAIPLTAE